MNITGVEITQQGGLILKNRGFDFVIDFGKPVNVERKFSNYKAFMQKAVQDSLVFQYKKINLRFTQQVVCTK
jgi:cell division protein FtsQ